MKLRHILYQILFYMPPQTWWGVYSLLFTLLVLFLALAFLGHYLKGALP